MPLILLFMVVLAWASLAPGQSAAEPELHVGTFNARYSGAKDGENAWPNRRALFMETIRRADPDILGLQEVTPMQQADLERELADFASVATFRDDEK